MKLIEKVDNVKQFRAIDDVFFEVFANDKNVCQEMLRTIMEDDNIIVEDVIVQSSARNLYGRSVRLDALCTLADGSKCNIEVQRSDKDNHIKRMRCNASVITAKESNPGSRFEDLLDLHMVYISEFDIFKQGKTIYHIDKKIGETGTIVDDGVHEIYVNASVNDGSKIAELMSCMTQKEVDNENFPEFSKRFKYLKTSEGGLRAVCEIMEKLMDEARVEGKAEGKAEEKIQAVINMFTVSVDESFIMSMYPDEFEEGKKLFLAGQTS